MAYGLLITIGVMAAALVFVAITRRAAAQPPVVTEVAPAEEEAPASSSAATVPAAAAAGTVAMAVRTAVRTAMCELLATRANWPSCEAGSTSVGLETSKVVEGETLHYLWFVSSDLMVRCYRTINPTFTFIEGDWGLARSPRWRLSLRKSGSIRPRFPRRTEPWSCPSSSTATSTASSLRR